MIHAKPLYYHNTVLRYLSVIVYLLHSRAPVVVV